MISGPRSQTTKGFIPAVWVTQKPLIASPYLDYVPSNCGVLTDVNSWILDFGELASTYGVEFSRRGMRYFKPALMSRPSAVNESLRMAAYLKARFLGIDLAIEPIQFSAFSAEVQTDLMEFWQIYVVSTWKCCGKTEVEDEIPQFNDKGFRGYYIPRILEMLERVNGDVRSYVRFRPFSHRNPISNSHNTFHVELHFALYGCPGDTQQAQRAIAAIAEKLGAFRVEIETGSSRKSALFAKSAMPYYLLYIAADQRSLRACVKVDTTDGECPFPTELKLPASFACPGEIFSASPKSHRPEDFVEFGHKLNYGVPSQLKGTHLIDAFTQHGSIFGTTGMGKTTFFLNLMDQTTAKRPDVGFLIINLAKSNQVPLFGPRVDQVVIYGDDLCHIPYYVEMPVPLEYALRNPEDAMGINAIGLTAAMITAGLGLGNPVDSILKIILEKYHQNDMIPTDILTFLNTFDTYLDKHPYGRDYQPNLRQYFTNRKLALADKTLVKTMAYYKNYIPLWFQWWREGKSIMLDLSPCQDKRRQRFLMFGILNLIRVLTVNDCNPSQKLRSVVFIDEAKRFLTAPPVQDPHDDETQAHAMTREINSQTMAETRERGIGFFNADTSPGDLIESAWKIPALKICFSLNGKESALLTEDPHMPQHIGALRKYQALVINTTSGEKYMIQTEPPAPVARQDVMPAAGGEWWLYQKAVNDPGYLNPTLFADQMDQALSEHIAEDFKRGMFLKVARVSHCLANNGLRAIFAEHNSSFPNGAAGLWEAFEAITKHYGDFGKITSVPEWAWGLLPAELRRSMEQGKNSNSTIIYDTLDLEIQHPAATIQRIDQLLLDPRSYAALGEALLPLVAIHSHMLAYLTRNLRLHIFESPKMLFASLLMTLRNEGVWQREIQAYAQSSKMGAALYKIRARSATTVGGPTNE